MTKGAIWALGAMSGTSLDGVDAAMVLTDGHTIEAFGKSAFRAYSEKEAGVLRDALGALPGEARAEAAAVTVEDAHAEVLSEFEGAELIGFHGQTLHHDPDNALTHQCGNGQVLTEALETPVVWDFRSSDVTMGGQGAPLAPFFHFACAKWIAAKAPIGFLNLGGVGNLTWVDPKFERPEDEGALLAFDTGPANAPLNDLMRDRLDKAFDNGGALAAEGAADEGVIERVLSRGYFAKIPPKSLDRDAFADLDVSGLSDADAAATLTALVAATVADGLQHCQSLPERLLVTGGGRKNPVMMAMIADRAGVPVTPVEEVGLDGDMLEAQAFAYLAVRVSRGLPTTAPGTTGVPAPVGGGRLSTPIL
ncbi:MAG: anhydro-N-acetylmuramic acid kinase [Pseudomonadota bacterium]